MPTSAATSVLVVTGRDDLAERVERLVGAVGLTAHRVRDVESAGSRWRDVPLVLLDEEAAAAGVPVRRTGTLLVDDGAGESIWRRAVEVAAEAVVRLPADEAWLLERLAAAADGDRSAGRVVGVVGGRGGAGASTLAAGLAATAAAGGQDVLLVDADPDGGGLDLLLGAEEEPGLRWEDLHGVRGALRASVLRDGLPAVAGLRLLSFGRDPGRTRVGLEAVEAVLEAARRGADLVVVDLPRADDELRSAVLWRLDVLVVVVPAEVRAAAAAALLVARLRARVPDVRLVVRGPAPTGVAADVVAEAVGVPVTLLGPDEPQLAADADHGRVPALDRPRSGFARLCRRLLADVHAAPARAA